MYIARQNIPLRGHNEQNLSSNRENFLELIKLIGKYHTILNLHIKKIENMTKNGPTFLSNISQNKL